MKPLGTTSFQTAAVITSTLFVASVSTAEAQLDERVARATVAIETRCAVAGAPVAFRSASGAVVGRCGSRAVIATAWHAVQCSGRSAIAVRLPDPQCHKKATDRLAEVVVSNPANDLAYLVIDLPPSYGDLPGLTLAPAMTSAEESLKILAVGWRANPTCRERRQDSRSGPWIRRTAATGKETRVGGRRLVAHGGQIHRQIEAFDLAHTTSLESPPEGTFQFGSLLLHDAPVVEGQSGGPLVDLQGRLLGIHVGTLHSRDPDQARGMAATSVAAPMTQVPEVCDGS